MSTLYPLKLSASLREKIWGVYDLSPFFPSYQVDQAPIGEAWYSFEENRVQNGDLAGRSLGSLIDEFGPRLMGSRWRPLTEQRRSAGSNPDAAGSAGPYFPILSKLLFTSQKLSVQVHPGDEYALAHHGGPGKTEMWYVIRGAESASEADLHQPEFAAVALGLKRKMDTRELRAAAQSGAIEAELNWVKVRAGDVVFVPAGTIHALGPGLVVCEIQQNSDLTYRLYDYGRLGADGKPRPLHLSQALDVLDQSSIPVPRRPQPASGEPLRLQAVAACEYFSTERLTWRERIIYTPEPVTFQLIIFLSGSGRIAGADFSAGDCFLIPPAAQPFELTADQPAAAIRAGLAA